MLPAVTGVRRPGITPDVESEDKYRSFVVQPPRLAIETVEGEIAAFCLARFCNACNFPVEQEEVRRLDRRIERASGVPTAGFDTEHRSGPPPDTQADAPEPLGEPETAGA